MALWTDVADPAHLTEYSRLDLADWEVNQATLAAYLPNNPVDDIYAELEVGGDGMVDAATYRAYDAETPIGGAAQGQSMSFRLPPLGKKERVGEYDQLVARRVQDSDERVLTSLERVATRRTRSIANRLEIARGQALTTGKVTIAENGFVAELDFGRDSSMAVTAATWWDDDAADQIAQLDTYCTAYRDLNGEDPGVVVTSSRVMSALMRSVTMRTLAGNILGTPGVLSRQIVQTQVQEFGLPPIQLYDRKVKVGSSNVRVTPSNRIYLLPAPVAVDDPDSTDLGATFWGTTLEAADPRYNIEDGDQPGVVVGAYRDDDPLGVWVKASGIAVPGLANPNLAMTVQVLAS